MMDFFFCYFFSLLIILYLLISKKEWGELVSVLEYCSFLRISPHSFNKVTKDHIEFQFALIKVLVNVTNFINKNSKL